MTSTGIEFSDISWYSSVVFATHLHVCMHRHFIVIFFQKNLCELYQKSISGFFQQRRSVVVIVKYNDDGMTVYTAVWGWMAKQTCSICEIMCSLWTPVCAIISPPIFVEKYSKLKQNHVSVFVFCFVVSHFC